jgi:hypothetical protein
VTRSQEEALAMIQVSPGVRGRGPAGMWGVWSDVCV